MESGAVLLESKSSPINLLHEMHQLRLLGHLCDVTVSVEYQGVREEFMAHKAVLAATSKFFKEVFLNEKTVDGARTNVYLDEVQVADFASFLEFVYTAKVQVEEDRVQRMLEMAEKYPEYSFDKHKGYGTKAHYAALREFGPSPIHRPSFLKKMH